MAVSLTHTTVAVGTDAGNGEIAKAQWNENHTLTMATARLLGRTTAGAGAVEEISVGTGLSLSGGSLTNTVTATSPGGSDTQIQFNDGGSFGGDADLTWDKTNNVLTLGADLLIRRRAAATLQLGAADAAAPVAQTLAVQSVVAGTTNTAGANFTITGSQGTGTGAGGSINFQVAPAGSSGTAQNSLVTFLEVTSARAVNLYNTTDVTTNFERGFVKWSSNILRIGTEKGGSGTARSVEFQTDGTTVLTLNSAFNGTFARHILLGGASLPSGQTNTSGFWGLWPGADTSIMASTAGGYEGITFNSNLVRDASNWQLQNNSRSAWHLFMGHGSSADNFEIYRSPSGSVSLALLFRISSTGMVQFAGKTSSFPALKRNSTALETKLADDSAYAPHAMQYLDVTDGITAPSAATGRARIYVDTADGDLKVIFADGTIKTIVTDT